MTVAVILALGLGGCGADSAELTSPSRATDNSGLNVSVDLDRQTGAIIFPGDRFQPNPQELSLLNSVPSFAISDCVNALGVYYVPELLPWDPLYNASNYFGVWTAAMADRFAFVTPMTQADLRGNDVMVNGESVPESANDSEASDFIDLSTPEATAAIAECIALPDAARFVNIVSPGPWAMELGNAHDLARQTQEWKDAVGEYHECLRGKGIEPDPADYLDIIGMDNRVIDSEQISLALEVVDCKDQVKLVERLAGQIAAFQAPVIDEYATEMVAYRAQIDALLVEARDYLATKGVSL